MKSFGLVLATIVAASVFAVSAQAQQGKPGAKKRCSGGMSACIERCVKVGGQPRLCPRFCQSQRGC